MDDAERKSRSMDWTELDMYYPRNIADEQNSGSGPKGKRILRRRVKQVRFMDDIIQSQT